MLKYYVKASDLLQRLRTDKDGTVSWEYILVAALVIVAVGTAFGPGATGAVEVALKTGIATIVTSFNGFHLRADDSQSDVQERGLRSC